MKRLSYKEFAEKVFQNRENDGYGIDFYCNYNPETGEKEWGYRAGVVRFADTFMVLVNYYGGGACFVDDIEDGDFDGFAYCLQRYLAEQGFEGSVWLEGN